MTDQEMLQAMSKMMDEKLDPIKKEISTIREDLEETCLLYTSPSPRDVP